MRTVLKMKLINDVAIKPKVAPIFVESSPKQNSCYQLAGSWKMQLKFALSAFLIFIHHIYYLHWRYNRSQFMEGRWLSVGRFL